MLKLRSALTVHGHGRLLLDALSPKRRAVAKNPCVAQLNLLLRSGPPCGRYLHRLGRARHLRYRLTASLAALQLAARTASKTMRRSLPLLALAALGAAFVPQTQKRLAVRVRADEIEAAEDAADVEPRTAPEVNSGAERCMNQTVATRPRHRRDACSIA